MLPFPAFIEGRYLDVLAANPLATALSPRLYPGANRLRDLFLDHAEQALFDDWERAAAAPVAGFRQSVGSDIDDPRFIDLVGELSLASPHFRRLWARHDVGPRRGANLTIDHPQVGPIRLDREKLGVTGTDGAMLVIYHPEPAPTAPTNSPSLPPLQRRHQARRQAARAVGQDAESLSWIQAEQQAMSSNSWSEIPQDDMMFESSHSAHPLRRRRRRRRRSEGSVVPVLSTALVQLHPVALTRTLSPLTRPPAALAAAARSDTKVSD